MGEDELAFDGIPIEVLGSFQDEDASASGARPSGAAGIAESFLTEVARAHRAVLDAHQAVSEHLTASAGSVFAEEPPHQTIPEVPAPRSASEAGEGTPEPRSTPDAGAPRQRLRPRLPVGDMRMYGTELEFEGTPGESRIGSALVSDFPVPADAWFRSDDRTTLVNLAWQEIALQATGVLGAASGIAAEYPDEDFVCRNLEGRARLPRLGSPLGRTLRVRSELLAHTPLHRAVLLRFGFAVTLDGEPCYEGETVHGFFTPDALSRQQGLDGGRLVPTWLERQSSPPRVVNIVPPVGGGLQLIDDADIVLGGGDHGAGYVLARKRIDPAAWYFDEHFPGDPVMPGSMGVEMLFHALRAYGVAAGLTEGVAEPHWAPAPGAELTWKYRGQVLREHDHVQGEVHLRSVRREPHRVLLHADGGLYRDGLRIYQVEGISIELTEGRRP